MIRRGLARAAAAEVAVVAFAAGYNVLFHRVLPRRAHLVSNLAASAALVGTARLAGEGWKELGLQPERVDRGLRVGLLTAIPLVAGVAGAAMIPATRRFLADERITETSRREATFETLVRIPLETALSEEVIFRGVLLGLALRTRSPAYAIASTSLLFGLWHVYPTLLSIQRGTGGDAAGADPARLTAATASVVVATAAAGAAFAGLRLYSGSVVAPVITHAALNMTAFAAVRVGAT